MDNKDKSKKVREMFSAIAPSYDLLNFLLSFGVDRYWRRVAVKVLDEVRGKKYLDVAAGTADVSLEIAKKTGDDVKIIGVDFSQQMLDLGVIKVKNRGYSKKVELKWADALSLPFESNSFDGVISAFGVRNFSDTKKGISEMKRILREGGKIVVLEFTVPTTFVFRQIYYFYFNYLLPVIGGLISGKKEAYKYLPDSVAIFSSGGGLKQIMEEEGFKHVKKTPLTFGIAAIYQAVK